MKGYFFVADLLGFGKIVENLDSKALDKRMQEWIELVKNAAKECGIENRIQLISDTVFAAAEDSRMGLIN